VQAGLSLDNVGGQDRLLGLEGALLDPLPFAATEDVRSALARIGRTEDVAFSPDERRLAIAGFHAGTCLVFDIEMRFSGGRKSVALSRPFEFTSPDLKNPHGLAFIDSKTLVVADRAAEKVSVFAIPPRGSCESGITLDARPVDGDGALSALTMPGSVAVLPRSFGSYDIFVCSNDANTVTRHRLRGKAHPRVIRNDLLAKATLDIPDGVAISPSRRWIAVSSHKTRSVQMFRNTPRPDPRALPEGILHDAGYPHGVRFTNDGRFVLVADAGGPVVYAYRCDTDDWRGVRLPVTTTQVMSEEVFQRGRINPEEGGPKGIAVDRGMNVLVTTCDCQPLAFFDLNAVLGRG
jgi:hypothetical protein